jgi:hypothetical protein
MSPEVRHGLPAFLGVILTVFSTPAAGADDSGLSIDGVIDLEFRYEAGDSAKDHAEFDLHHFNLISQYQITRHWRILGELEFEHGPDVQSGSVAGRITLEQAWMEYRHNRQWQIRLGKFLPPFGLYNEIHDRTPIHLFVRLPQAIYGFHEVYPGHTQELFNKFLTGVQFRGTTEVGGAAVADIRVYAGNGRGPNSHGEDLNANKALGGKMILRERDGRWHAGLSYYRDRNGHADDALQQHSLLEAKWTPPVFSKSIELLTEITYSRLEQLDGSGNIEPLGAYLMLVLYPQKAFMPWIRGEAFRLDSGRGGETERSMWLGGAYDVASQVRLKVDIYYAEGGSLGVRRGVLMGVAAHF